MPALQGSRTQPEARTSRRTAGGLTLHTWQHRTPQAPPVVLVHGFGSSTQYNCVKTGWIAPLMGTQRSVLCVDLPGHGDSGDVDPRGLRSEDLTAELADQLDDLGPVELHGYSLGSRLCWELAAARPELISTLVMGGAPATDRIGALDAQQARRWYRTGELPTHEMTRAVIPTAAALPGQNVPHAVELLLSLAEEPYAPSASVPGSPTLVVAGEQDRIAADAAELTDLLRGAGTVSEFVSVPDRNHVNVLTSQVYKRSVMEFLSR